MADAFRHLAEFAIFGAVGFALTFALAKALGKAGAFQQYRRWGPIAHFAKGNVPTAGGVVFILGTTLFWIYHVASRPWGGDMPPILADRAFITITVICATTVLTGLVGFADDYLKLAGKGSLGVPARYRFALQLLLGAFASFLLAPEGSQLELPPNRVIWEPSPLLFAILGAVMFAAIVNGVNFTDGLDGLASGAVLISFFGLSSINSFASNDILLSLVFASCGLIVGYLALNLKPARIFMGDTGSYALGALVALLFISSGLLFAVFLLGIVYFVEIASVIAQVAIFRLTGRRLFRMSPVHHHFEQLGYREETVVAGLWIVQAIGCAIGVLAAAKAA
ncbi:MAG: phospho-N-acetylmuramoyl-pentapeptide-transferase [bacterium]|jgi:phospho-N-acetylmuramoyl-pentapeptide-transferase